jgi:positive regulator of sigma E activity
MGVLLSFSRADVVALMVFAPLYFLVLNRHQLARAIAVLLIGAFIIIVLTAIAFVSFHGFQEKLMSRLTLAEPYDLGRMGRYARYVLAIPLILEHPFGLGMLQIDKIFPEPIHNIFISSFVNYGWLAGVAWLMLTILSVKVTFRNYAATKSPVAVWLGFSLGAQLPCALLQQVEHWRHLWMFFGLVWGFNIANFVRRPAPARQAWQAPPQQAWAAPPVQPVYPVQPVPGAQRW